MGAYRLNNNSTLLLWAYYSEISEIHHDLEKIREKLSILTEYLTTLSRFW